MLVKYFYFAGLLVMTEEKLLKHAKLLRKLRNLLVQKLHPPKDDLRKYKGIKSQLVTILYN